MLRKSLLSIILILVFIASIGAFVGSFKGNIGNPVLYQKELDTRVGGPFEASNSSARYALTKSIVEERSLTLRDELARFSSPDVVDHKGKYISIFTPGVSFIGVPFYIIGSSFGLPQLFTFSSSVIFAILNLFLIAVIVRKLGGGWISGLLAGFVFTFATNAFPYALTLTQHMGSVFVVLSSLLISLGKPNMIKNILFGALFGIGVLIDFPNAFFLVPVGLFILSKHFNREKINDNWILRIKLGLLATIIGIIPLAGLFAWYNYKTTGSYATLAQSLGRSDKFSIGIAPHLSPEVEKTDEIDIESSGGLELPFDTRNQMESFYVLMISNERAWIFYCPIVLLGILGFYVFYRSGRKNEVIVMTGIVGTVIVLYSMFGDPWGGWSYGPRYLIPAAAVLSIGIGGALTKFKRNIFFIILFMILFSYSAYINTLGALTTNSIPPKVEAVNLPSPIPYTFEYNLDLVNANRSSSLLYNLFLVKHIDLRTYLNSFTVGIISLGVLLYLVSFFEDKRTNEEKILPGIRINRFRRSK